MRIIILGDLQQVCYLAVQTRHVRGLALDLLESDDPLTDSERQEVRRVTLWRSAGGQEEFYRTSVVLFARVEMGKTSN